MRQSFAWETTSILSNHLGPPLDFNTGQKNESRLGNLGAQNGLFLVFLCNYFLSSYCRKKKVKVNSTQVLDISCQIKSWSHGLLALLLSLNPCHSFFTATAIFAWPLFPSSSPIGPSVCLTTLNYLKHDTIYFFVPSMGTALGPAQCL